MVSSIMSHEMIHNRFMAVQPSASHEPFKRPPLKENTAFEGHRFCFDQAMAFDDRFCLHSDILNSIFVFLLSSLLGETRTSGPEVVGRVL